MLEFFGILPKHIGGATSDAGSDVRSAFSGHARTEYGWHDCLDPMVQECRRLLRELIEDRFHRQQGYAVKRVKADRYKHVSVKLAQQRCWVLDMAFFLYPPQV